MRTSARVTLVLAALAAFSAHEARGQAHLSFSVGVGPLFAGVGFGIGGGDYAPGRYDRGRRSSYSCWDYYWDSYWDPYSDWFYDCVAYSPWRYNSFRTRSWLSRRGGYYGSRSAFVYIRDPFAIRWGRYWDYDPWGSYWGGGYWGGYYGGVRAIRGRGGRTTVVVNRPSPRIGSGSRHAESPRTTTGRTAVRRRGTTATAAVPARTPARAGTDTGRRVRPSSVPTAGRAGARVARPSGRTATPRRGVARPSTRSSAPRSAPRAGGLSTRARPSSSARPSSRLPSRNSATARPTGARTRSPRVSSGANRPGTRATPRTTPSTRRAAARTPTTRSAPSRSSRTGPAPSRVPRTRSAPSRAPSTRSAPSRAPRASSAPSRTPRTRSAPSRAPSTRSAPRAQAKPPARSSRGGSSRPARRRRGG